MVVLPFLAVIQFNAGGGQSCVHTQGQSFPLDLFDHFVPQ